MRSILLTFAFLVAASAAAEREAITLADGRTLVGVYDADAGTIALDGKAVVKVRADQVKAREPAPAKAPPAAAAAAPTAEAAPKQKAKTVSVIFAACDQEVVEENARHDKLLRAIADRRAEQVGEWLTHADLEDLPLPAVNDDPRESEKQYHWRATRVNEVLRRLREIRKDVRDKAGAGIMAVEQLTNLLRDRDRLLDLLDGR